MTTATVRPVRTLAIAFTVWGEPIPQGSKDAIPIKTKSGKTIINMVENNPRTGPWRERVARYSKTAAGSSWALLDGPLALRLAFTMPKPASYPKTIRRWPDHSSDLDKCCRAICDAITGTLITNDSRIVQMTAEQHFPCEHPEALEKPGVRIGIWTISEPDLQLTLDGPA